MPVEDSGWGRRFRRPARGFAALAGNASPPPLDFEIWRPGRRALMTTISVELSTPADDAAIRNLVRREPVPGRITIGYEREPEFSIGCSVTGDDVRILVARAGPGGPVVGVACRSTRKLFVNGCERRLGYLGQLRLDQAFRGRWIVSRGFEALRRLHDSDPLPAYVASIIEGNREAAGVLVDKPRRRFPGFRRTADFCTFAIEVRRGKPAQPCGARISAASADQLPEIAKFLRTHGASRQFFPVWTEESLQKLTGFGLRIEDLRLARRSGRIVGVIGLWDQSAYKQTVVRAYSGWLKAAAPFYNGCAPWLGRPALPRPGEKLRGAYAAFICIADDDPAVFAALLRDLHDAAAGRGFDYLLAGLDARDPLAPVAGAYPHVLYPSRLYLVEWPDGGRLYEQLDERPAYLDIATL